ncbi:5-methylcytosine-specific restriction endonuclease McrA [Methylobacterium sp. BE186]|uniref:HNH endonuclease n=1 Tax=Methylobacterium sp. BE186 TaxID=2817715 RepID=UPI002858171E|nr:HNH endonuclease signature motif containing protein [Methylobacterium sp. BE186]MDR7037362.1 5-methylcytosine-specific restriction endonuclease McrA [Methylobacterium sp. BE186]
MASRKRWSASARLRIFLAHNGHCHVCGGKITVGEAWDLDHIIALALGGDDEEGNLAPAHRKGCHAGKTAAEDVPAIAKAKRRAQRHLGIRKASKPLPCGRNSPFKKLFSGEVVRRDNS